MNSFLTFTMYSRQRKKSEVCELRWNDPEREKGFGKYIKEVMRKTTPKRQREKIFFLNFDITQNQNLVVLIALWSQLYILYLIATTTIYILLVSSSNTDLLSYITDIPKSIHTSFTFNFKPN